MSLLISSRTFFGALGRFGSATLLLMTMACAHLHAQPVPDTRAAPDNALLLELATEDQAVRRGTEVTRSDADRVKLVLAELGAGRVVTSPDRFRAALVLQHSPLTVRDGEITAVNPDHYLLAHHLASTAFEAGYAPARMLVAQSIDRYLSMSEGYQKYGTNRFINQKTGAEELAPIDRNTTDAERARYGVPPLAELLKRFPEAARKTRAP